MAELSYPSGLPKPETDGYAIQQQSPTVNQSSITGRSVPRRRFRTVPSFVSVKWNMSHEEALLFESWFAAESEFGGIQDGTLWFDCPLQTPASGNVVEYYEARFTGIYEGPTLWSFNRWTFTATLELRKRQILSGGWAQFPEFTIGSSIIDYAMNREWPESQEGDI